jgi:hypothetical protein
MIAQYRESVDRRFAPPGTTWTALRGAQKELAKIKTAISHGIITPTTKAMLEDAQHRVATADSAFRRRHPLFQWSW